MGEHDVTHSQDADRIPVGGRRAGRLLDSCPCIGQQLRCWPQRLPRLLVLSLLGWRGQELAARGGSGGGGERSHRACSCCGGFIRHARDRRCRSRRCRSRRSRSRRSCSRRRCSLRCRSHIRRARRGGGGGGGLLCRRPPPVITLVDPLAARVTLKLHLQPSGGIVCSGRAPVGSARQSTALRLLHEPNQDSVLLTKDSCQLTSVDLAARHG